jgi:hypothetical protein
VGEDGVHDSRGLHRGDEAEAAVTAGTGQAIEGEHLAHQGVARPLAQGTSGAGEDASVAVEVAFDLDVLRWPRCPFDECSSPEW